MCGIFSYAVFYSNITSHNPFSLETAWSSLQLMKPRKTDRQRGIWKYCGKSTKLNMQCCRLCHISTACFIVRFYLRRLFVFKNRVSPNFSIEFHIKGFVRVIGRECVLIQGISVSKLLSDRRCFIFIPEKEIFKAASPSIK